MKIAVVVGALLAVVTVATPGLCQPPSGRLIYDASHQVIGFKGFAMSCAQYRRFIDPTNEDHCQPFSWIVRFTGNDEGGLVFKVISGGDPHATSDKTILNIGDDKIRPTATEVHAANRFIYERRKVQVTGFMAGPQGVAHIGSAEVIP